MIIRISSEIIAGTNLESRLKSGYFLKRYAVKDKNVFLGEGLHDPGADDLVTFGTQFYFIRTCIPEMLDCDLFGKKIATGTKGRKDKYVSFHGGIC